MPFFVFIALAFLLGVPIAILVLFVRVRDLRAEAESLRSEMYLLRRELHRSRPPEPAQQAEPVLERRAALLESIATAPPPPVPPVAKPTPVFTAPPVVAAPAPEPPPQPARAARNANWEQFLGVKLFAWLGGLALFIGVAFFLKYSFDRDLIPEWLRVLMGFALGGGLIGGGQYFRRRSYLVTAQTLVASGLVILYAVSWVARTHYELIGTPALFVLMCGISVAAFALAIFMDAQVVAILGVLGGFLTPVLVGGRDPNPVVLFGYLGFLNAGLAAIGRRKGWPVLLRLGAAATILSELSWCFGPLNAENAASSLGMFVLLNAIYVISFYLESEPTREKAGPAFALSVAAIVTGGLLLAERGALGPWSSSLAVFAGFVACGALFLRSRWIPAAATGIGGSLALIVVWAEAAADRRIFEQAPWMICACVALGAGALVLARAAKPDAARQLLAGFAAGAPLLLLAYLGARLEFGSPHLLHVCILALSVAVIVAAVSMNEHLLLPIALAGAVIAQHAWQAMHLSPEASSAAGPWRLASFLMFTAMPFIVRRRLAPGESIPWRVSSSAGPAHFFLLHHSAKMIWPEFGYPGLFPALLGIPSVVAMIVLRKQTSGEERMRFTGIYAASALFFLTLIFPVQFEHEWLTIGWALEGAALLWLYRRVPLPWLPAMGTFLLAAAFVRLAVNPEVLGYHARSGRPILNWYLYAYGIVAAALFAAGRLASRETLRGIGLGALFNGAGVVLLFLLMNIEIADFFAEGQFLTFDFSKNFARDMTYSLAWGLFALALLIAGVARDMKPVRLAGLALMVATLVKLFFHDLSRLDQLYRIGAFIGLAVMLIFASWLYQKFMGRSSPAKSPAQS